MNGAPRVKQPPSHMITEHVYKGKPHDIGKLWNLTRTELVMAGITQSLGEGQRVI